MLSQQVQTLVAVLQELSPSWTTNHMSLSGSQMAKDQTLTRYLFLDNDFTFLWSFNASFSEAKFFNASNMWLLSTYPTCSLTIMANRPIIILAFLMLRSLDVKTISPTWKYLFEVYCLMTYTSGHNEPVKFSHLLVCTTWHLNIFLPNKLTISWIPWAFVPTIPPSNLVTPRISSFLEDKKACNNELFVIIRTWGCHCHHRRPVMPPSHKLPEWIPQLPVNMY